jgi:hypothetical protein
MSRRITSIILALAIGTSTLALSGCSDRLFVSSPDNYLPSARDTAVKATVGQGAAAARDQSAAPARMAVTHGFTLRVPSAEIEAVQRKHLDDCARLGCVVISTRLDRSNAGRVFANSSVRISPDGFAELAKALARPPAELVSHSQSAEDKTIPLLDLEKRVEVKTALRDRLNAMLREPSTRTTADLVAIEKELTQVQGEIEAAIAQRDYLRTITETVRVDINYSGMAALTAGVDFYPVQQAVSAIGQTVASSAASLITFLAATIPWLPLIALLAWGGRRLIRRRRAAT